MALEYAKSNGESAASLFLKRVMYRFDVRNSTEHPNLVDFNFGEKCFYGRVNRRFVPIFFTNTALSLKDFSSSNLANGQMKAINFVVDAFNDLAQQFEKCAATGKIDKNDTFLSNLKIYKAYIDPDHSYAEYLNVVFASLVNHFRSNKVRVQNFDDFIKEFIPLMNATARRFPFTQTAYTKHRMNSILTSGLAIEIADMDPVNDQEKIDSFINSNNWKFYVNACNSYGFMVDELIPWRLVADIASSPMLQYAAQYGTTTTDQILGNAYGNVHIKYIKKFRYFLLNLYNRIKLNNFLVTEDCNGTLISRTVYPKTYTKREFNRKYSKLYFLELYCQIRFIEEESIFKESERNTLLDDTMELSIAKGTKAALNNFELILNKPFDYRGSLTYNVRRTNLILNSSE